MQTPEPDCLSRPSWTSLSLLLTAGGPLEMETLWIPVLFLACLSGASAQEDLRGLAFIFPQGSIDSYVTLPSPQEEPLQNFTICLAAFSDAVRWVTLFSYATRHQDREIAIYKGRWGEFWQYEVYIGGTATSFRIKGASVSWQYLCISWGSETGVLTVQVDTKILPRKVVKKGYSIGPNAVIMLGQDYPSHAKRMISGSPFSGEITEVDMWNYTIPNRDLGSFPSYPPIISWRNLQYELKGDIALESCSFH
ncbi:mucosal pentraxin-like isoform X2 [Hemicordylus capensis]|uniref:mucosal pentraxin-like isoform X2 n=1 Tax=Hemicordylus capensis TaxID=884348 RepID=UPI0023027652|nr:mucosal pentraxin-like isoform X2 [Hemicordylus capensis]